MGELRAPDPTLDGLGEQDVDVDWTAPHNSRLPVAHHVDHDCRVDLSEYQPADIARWFAVPCRECFPEAPPPGGTTHGARFDDYWRPYLAWQVPDTEGASR